jgi:long-chain acyl-CoA synthetase
MTNQEYFQNMLAKEDFERIPYLPTMGQFVNWFTKEYADLPALSDTVNTITYKELGSRVARRRAFIEGLGLPKGSHIAVFDRNSQDAIELYLAITSAGYVVMMFPSMLPEMAVIGSCMKFDIAAIFVREEFMPLTGKLQGVKVLPAASIAEAEAPVADIDPDSTAAIFFTGGTTGQPKGAVLSHRALMRGNYNAIFKPGKVIGVHRYIALLPLSHVFGAIAGTAGCFYTGNLLFTAEDMKATIGKLPAIKPTLLVIVPGICDILSGLVKMYGPQFLGGELRMIISGAANVPPRLVDIFTKLGVEFCFGYGLTETANLTSANANAVEKPTSIGRIYPGQETKVVDGELWVKGDNVFSGYYKDPEKTAEALTEDGWLRTGDLVSFDEEGFLYITGRIKNLIILSNGENVSPESLEEPFYADACVRDAMVKEDELNGNTVIAIEILPFMPAFDGKPWEEVEAYMNQLVAKVNATLPSTHQIRKVTVRTEDFKRTGSMKVARV